MTLINNNAGNLFFSGTAPLEVIELIVSCLGSTKNKLALKGVNSYLAFSLGSDNPHGPLMRAKYSYPFKGFESCKVFERTTHRVCEMIRDNIKNRVFNHSTDTACYETMHVSEEHLFAYESAGDWLNSYPPGIHILDLQDKSKKIWDCQKYSAYRDICSSSGYQLPSLIKGNLKSLYLVNGNIISLWDANKTPLHCHNYIDNTHRQKIKCLDIKKDRIYSMTKGTIKVWDCMTGNQLTSVINDGSTENHQMFSDGNLVYRTFTKHNSYYDRETQLDIWDCNSGKVVQTWTGFLSECFQTDGDIIYLGQRCGVSVIDRRNSSRPVVFLESQNNQVSVMNRMMLDGSYLFTSKNPKIEVYDLKQQKSICLLPNERLIKHKVFEVYETIKDIQVNKGILYSRSKYNRLFKEEPKLKLGPRAEIKMWDFTVDDQKKNDDGCNIS